MIFLTLPIRYKTALIEKHGNAKEKKEQKKIKTNSGRRRINIIGVVNPITMKTTTIITEDNCNKSVVVAYLEKIRKEYPTRKKIYMLLDNASYNRARMVREKAKRCNINWYIYHRILRI